MGIKVKGKLYSPNNIWSYFIGNYRYYFWYGGYWSRKFGLIAKLRKKMIREHIKEQIAWRIKWMDQKCFWAGSCKMCGCQTTALQMANKSCDKPCYPPMMSKKEWKWFWKEYPLGGYLSKDGDIWRPDNEGRPVSRAITYNQLKDYVLKNSH